MDILLYLVFGALDQMAIMIIAFKMFRFPVTNYLREFLIIASIISLISYFNRVVLGIPQYDTGIQYIALVLFFRHMLEFRLYEATLVAATGCIAFTGIQFVALSLLLKTSLVNLNDLGQVTELGTFIIQFVADVLVILVAWLLKLLNLGYSFISQPPHSMTYKPEKNKLTFFLILAVGLTVFILTTVLYVLIMSQANTVIILAYVLIPLAILLWLLRKRDYL
ncbi:hypothetical protein O0555_21145 [Brevibacillus laterosporus]|uniref:hypothetical protein n=1 Tax=Brevibacillus laterosporus TaxID=1465 RepID=UPI00215BA748|nr:hypothetical protein [Brevibacillus laterosporus]MCR8939810.1 hypothetical protein [Brevibacillus laterosporus]MCZ0842450.1 hypothetical protein [Brevibacillus laterosporus]MCZ0846447.1 hypothetical protein [Brevibacillus laterosporus]